jgi:hypothetical protein
LRTPLTPHPKKHPQVDAAKVHIAPSWQPVLDNILRVAAEALGISDAGHISANLYKLLLYEEARGPSHVFSSQATPSPISSSHSTHLSYHQNAGGPCLGPCDC